MCTYFELCVCVCVFVAFIRAPFDVRMKITSGYDYEIRFSLKVLYGKARIHLDFSVTKEFIYEVGFL